MRRDTLILTLAGSVFGFGAGYMAASWDVLPRPAAATSAAATAAPAVPAARRPEALDPNEARAMETLAARQPGDRAVRTELGNLYMDHQRWPEAIRWYREAQALAPEDADVATDLGACLVQAGQPEAGLAEFERVLKATPEHKNALFNKGVALLHLGRASEAAAIWEDLLRRYPDDPQLQRLRGRIEAIRSVAAPGSASGSGQAR